MKKILFIALACAVVGGGIFVYVTRPVSVPAEDISAASAGEQLSQETAAGTIYRISPEQSVVRFSIDEMLRGEPFTAMGETNQVTGDFSILHGASGKATIMLGTITIDAASFKTDSTQRDGAIVRLILKSDQPANRHIIFVPNAKTMEAAVSAGTSFALQVEGVMTISGVSKPQTLAITATENADGTVSGTVSLMLKRSDYNLVIPNIPFVANVSDEFETSGTFVATRAN